MIGKKSIITLLLTAVLFSAYLFVPKQAYAIGQDCKSIDTATNKCPAGLDFKCPQDAITCCPTSDLCEAGTKKAEEDAQFTDLCSYIADGTQKGKCETCMNPPKNGVWTAVGCLPKDASGLISSLLKFAINIAGGIAFLIILFGGFQIITSAGNPEQLNAGRELVGAAVAGLLLIIFSIFLLRLIGVDILGIPGFS